MSKPASRLGRGLGSLMSVGTSPANEPSALVASAPLPAESAITEVIKPSSVSSDRSSGKDTELLEIGTVHALLQSRAYIYVVNQ